VVAMMLFYRVLVKKHASTGASPAVSVQLLDAQARNELGAPRDICSVGRVIQTC
jgi:hypothetical protein